VPQAHQLLWRLGESLAENGLVQAAVEYWTPRVSQFWRCRRSVGRGDTPVTRGSWTLLFVSRGV
jgi:hypothetical protein